MLFILLYLCDLQKYTTMRMYTRAFNKMRELTDFVNEHEIPQERIITIFESDEKNFILIYYAK